MIGLETETALDLTTAARVKAWLGKSDVTDDTVIGYLIDKVSREAMFVMNRATIQSARSEYLDVEKDGQKIFYVKASPIITSTAPVVIYNTDTPRVWTDASDIISADYVICNADMAAQGIVYVDYELDEAVNALKITYTGGMATTVDNFIAAYPDIALAIDMQVGFLWRRKGTLGIRSEAMVGVNITWYNNLPWLADTLETLKNYKR